MPRSESARNLAQISVKKPQETFASGEARDERLARVALLLFGCTVHTELDWRVETGKGDLRNPFGVRPNVACPFQEFDVDSGGQPNTRGFFGAPIPPNANRKRQ